MNCTNFIVQLQKTKWGENKEVQQSGHGPSLNTFSQGQEKLLINISSTRFITKHYCIPVMVFRWSFNWRTVLSNGNLISCFTLLNITLNSTISCSCAAQQGLGLWGFVSEADFSSSGLPPQAPSEISSETSSLVEAFSELTLSLLSLHDELLPGELFTSLLSPFSAPAAAIQPLWVTWYKNSKIPNTSQY